MHTFLNPYYSVYIMCLSHSVSFLLLLLLCHSCCCCCCFLLFFGQVIQFKKNNLMFKFFKIFFKMKQHAYVRCPHVPSSLPSILSGHPLSFAAITLPPCRKGRAWLVHWLCICNIEDMGKRISPKYQGKFLAREDGVKINLLLNVIT